MAKARMGVHNRRSERSILFSFEADLVGRVKARPADRNLAGAVTAGLHTSRDSFYRTTTTGTNARGCAAESAFRASRSVRVRLQQIPVSCHLQQIR